MFTVYFYKILQLQRYKRKLTMSNLICQKAIRIYESVLYYNIKFEINELFNFQKIILGEV